MRKNMKPILLLVILMTFMSARAQSWINLGATYSGPSPYPYKYFLLLDMNGYNGDISVEFEIMVLADDNHMYHSRSSIFASRHSGTPVGRLDGVSLNYLSGKPGMLEVLVKNNQIWMRATAKWGSIKYRMIDAINHGLWTTPLTSQNIAPTNILTFSTQPFYYDYDASKMNHFLAMLPNGNVGIGTTAPDSKLTVKGNIHAEEVKVDLSVPAPDYVFKEGYSLRTLEETQNYINEQGHLPNIPSAKEMKENGIQLGEMNMKLLEKIEELTLYAIEQEKRQKQLERRIHFLEKE